MGMFTVYVIRLERVAKWWQMPPKEKPKYMPPCQHMGICSAMPSDVHMTVI